jgi:hypothetical protein
MRKNTRANHHNALGDAMWDLGQALSAVLLSAGVALSVARVTAPGQAVRPSVPSTQPVTLDSCPPLELPQGWGVKLGGKWQPAYLESQVERPARLLRGDPWDGMDTTRLVIALFAVDTAGRPIEGSVDVSNVYAPRRQRLWELPSVVRGLRYRPAEQPLGRKVCQVVQQPIGIEVW